MLGDFLLVGAIRDYAPVPEELFLRGLFGLDTSSSTAMCGFFAEHGPLTSPGLALLPVDEEPVLRLTLQKLRSRGRPAVGTEWAAVPLDEVRLSVGALRDVMRVLDAEGRFRRKDTGKRWKWESIWRQEPTTREDRNDFVRQVLNAGLAPYRLGFLSGGKSGAPQDATAPWLYSALCLQLANFIVEDVPYRTCPECLTLFVRQPPRSRNQPWVGKATFCCDDHARRWQYRTPKDQAWRKERAAKE